MGIIQKYGKTNTVANICKAHGVPLEHGFAYTDGIIHHRWGHGWKAANQWMICGLDMGVEIAFQNDIYALASWMRSQWQ